MSYVLYNVHTTKLVKPKNGYSDFRSAAAAMRARTLGGYAVADYAVADANSFYCGIEKKEIRTNFMSGKEFEARVNDSYSSCPSSETYWSN